MSDDKAMRERLRKHFGLVPTGELASNFCERELISFAQSELSRARSEAVRDVAGDESEGANALTVAETNCALQALQWLNESPRKSSMDVRFDWRSAYALSRLFDRLYSRLFDARNRIAALEAELDRLRAEVTDLKARLYAEQYEADNLVGASHVEVLKLRDEVARLRGLIRTAAQVGQQSAGGKATFTFHEWMTKVDELCAEIRKPEPQPAEEATQMLCPECDGHTTVTRDRPGDDPLGHQGPCPNPLCKGGWVAGKETGK